MVTSNPKPPGNPYPTYRVICRVKGDDFGCQLQRPGTSFILGKNCTKPVHHLPEDVRVSNGDHWPRSIVLWNWYHIWPTESPLHLGCRHPPLSICPTKLQQSISSSSSVRAKSQNRTPRTSSGNPCLDPTLPRLCFCSNQRCSVPVWKRKDKLLLT